MTSLVKAMHPELMEMILDEVCGDFIKRNCQHCSSPRCTCHEKTAHGFVHRALPSIYALASLNRTCRYIHELTTRRLYRCPVTEGSQEAWYLARTLFVRPDLAQLVKVLILKESERPGPGPGPRSDDDGVPEEMIQYYEEKIGAAGFYLHKGRPCLGGSRGVPIDIVTSLCPSIKHLEATYYLDHDSTFFWPRHTSTTTLKNIKIQRDGNCPIRPEEMQELLRWAPNVESITFSCFYVGIMGPEYKDYDGSALRLRRVKRVEFERSILTKTGLSRVFCIFPNLEDLVFTFRVGHIVVFTPLRPIEVAELTLSHLQPGKLKRFVMDMTQEARLRGPFGRGYPQQYRKEIPKATEMLAKVGVEFVYKTYKETGRRRGGRGE